MLKIAVDESEGITMDFLYQAMDWYKKAVILTREVEVSRIALGYICPIGLQYVVLTY